MEKQTHLTERDNLDILRSGDANTAFHHCTPKEILRQYGPPRTLLSSSCKIQKCLSVGVLARALYLTPGVFCPGATFGCLQACLGHTSGRMQMPTHAAARDRRTAQYLESQSLFLMRLRLEIAEHCQEALRHNLRPAIRLNCSSDLPWEDLHGELFQEFPDVQFFDYTKVVSRMKRFTGELPGTHTWPENYYLTFSLAPTNRDYARRILDLGRNVAIVFWPEIPSSYWGFPVINGEAHDVRFLDPQGVIVGLKAKGLAQVDLSGFTIRVCPHCGPAAPELSLCFSIQNTRRTVVHRCRKCGFKLRQQRTVPVNPSIHSLTTMLNRNIPCEAATRQGTDEPFSSLGCIREMPLPRNLQVLQSAV